MKKIFFLVMIATLSLPMFSQKLYDHSIGCTVGTMYGLSYKGFITDNLVIQADLGVNLFTTDGSVKSIHYTGVDFFTFEANPNLVYQDNIQTWSWGGLDWYAGGGLSLGLMRGLSGNQDDVRGKFGLNGTGGLEMYFNSLPLALSFDFRPGYGLGFDKDYTNHFFDWKLR